MILGLSFEALDLTLDLVSPLSWLVLHK